MANDIPVAFVHRSATRRKACTWCVKAKRRCDLTLPDCGRCRTRNLRCNYVNDEGSGTHSHEHEMEVRSSNSSTSSIGVIPDGPAVADHAITEFDSASPAAVSDIWLETAKTISTMTNFDAPIHSFPFPERVGLSNHQINYLVAQFRSSIKSFVLENKTPFIHPLLYRETVSAIYQDALGACSFYMHKTPQNRDAIFQMLDHKVTSLIEASTSLLATVEDDLLALQVLILYQVIRLFDGDIRQRANAERDLELLDLWTLRLQRNYFQALERQTIGDGGYENWVLVESIRRTTMVSVVLRSLYFAMKDGYCELVPLLCMLPVSRIGTRWKRQDWEWKEHEASPSGGDEVLTYAEFSQEWNKGNVCGVDDYEKLLLVACRHARGTGHFQAG